MWVADRGAADNVDADDDDDDEGGKEKDGTNGVADALNSKVLEGERGGEEDDIVQRKGRSTRDGVVVVGSDTVQGFNFTRRNEALICKGSHRFKMNHSACLSPPLPSPFSSSSSSSSSTSSTSSQPSALNLLQIELCSRSAVSFLLEI